MLPHEDMCSEMSFGELIGKIRGFKKKTEKQTNINKALKLIIDVSICKTTCSMGKCSLTTRSIPTL